MQFHILALEGPDPNVQASSLAARITGLNQARTPLVSLAASRAA